MDNKISNAKSEIEELLENRENLLERAFFLVKRLRTESVYIKRLKNLENHQLGIVRSAETLEEAELYLPQLDTELKELSDLLGKPPIVFEKLNLRQIGVLAKNEIDERKERSKNSRWAIGIVVTVIIAAVGWLLWFLDCRIQE